MTLVRSLVVASLAVAVARVIAPLLTDRRRFFRRMAWILLLAPYLTPVLLTGYAYGSFSLSLIHHPFGNALFYSALLWWKFTPIAAVILHFTPTPISAEAIHCRRLTAAGTSWWDDGLFLFRAGCGRGPVAAFAVVFLCAFAEFEMASLMVVKSWTVALFDAHAGGLALSESLRRMAGPLLGEAAAIATAVVVLGTRQDAPGNRIPDKRSRPWPAWAHLMIAFLFVVLIPAAKVLWGTFRGFRLLLENFVLSREILASLLFAAGASVLAGLAVFGLAGGARRNQLGSMPGKIILVAAVFAGLLGPLVLSLAVLAAIQLPGLIVLRDTPAPLVFTLGLVLFPIALVLRRVLALTGRRSAWHLTRLMQKSRALRDLTWKLNTRRKFWALAFLFIWAYWDLTASAIHAPIGMTPVTVRLYNLMHYGRIEALSAMTCAAFAAPISILFLAAGTRRWWAPP